MEQFPTKAERPPLDETEVVANLHINHDKILGGEMPASEALLTQTRDDLSRLECYPMFKEYSGGSVPTLEVLAESAQRAAGSIERLIDEDKAKGASDEELDEEIKLKNLLAGRADSIKRSVNTYISSIIRFHNLKRLAHGGRDATEQFVKADESRRRAHESLLKSLSILTASIEQAAEAGLIDTKRVHAWNRDAQSAQLMAEPENIVVFSQKTLSDRDYIKDWAISADFDSQLQDMFEALERAQAAK